MSVKVTLTDTESGSTESSTIDDDYVLVTAGSYYLSGVVKHANGTHVLTVKRGVE